MKKPTYIIIYGQGGHQEEMRRLLSHGVFCQSDNIHLIAFTDSCSPIEQLVTKNYLFREFRDKHSNVVTLLNAPWNVVKLLFFSLWVLFKYEVKGVITTGPGLAIIPFVIFKIFRVKTVAFETWAMFYSPTKTGWILSKIASLFFIQHQSLKKCYEKAIYRGLL